jgi:primosomal protein N''
MSQISALIERLQHELDKLYEAVMQLDAHDDEFQDWFDAALFHPSAQRPLDYVKQIERNLRRLAATTVAADQLWLAQRLSDQIAALYRALGYFQHHSTSGS